MRHEYDQLMGRVSIDKDRQSGHSDRHKVTAVCLSLTAGLFEVM